MKLVNVTSDRAVQALRSNLDFSMDHRVLIKESKFTRHRQKATNYKLSKKGEIQRQPAEAGIPKITFELMSFFYSL